MTDRVHSLVVVLKEDWRDDEVERVMQAIRMIGPVLSVEPIVTDFAAHMAEERARQEWRAKIAGILNV